MLGLKLNHVSSLGNWTQPAETISPKNSDYETRPATDPEISHDK